MLADDLIVLGVAATSVLLLISFAPFLIYYYHKYRSLQKSVIFRKRHASIVSVEVQIGLFKIMIESLIYISILIWYRQQHTLSLQFNALVAIDYITTLVLFYLWIWRFWLLHFGIHVNVAILANEWQFVINSKHKDNKMDWYLKNRHKFGNKTYIRNTFIIPACFTQIILIITPMFMTSLYFNFHHWWIIYFNFHLFVPFCILIAIYFSTTKFSDNFYIRKEFEKIFICLSITYSLMFTANILEVIFNFPTNLSTILYCIQVNVAWIGIFMSIITAIYWVPKQVLPLIINRNYQLREVAVRKRKSGKIATKKLMEKQHKLSTCTSQYDGYYQNANDMEYVEVLIMEYVGQTDKNIVAVNNIKNGKKIKLYQILGHYKGFELFVNHLGKEFSVECLLSLVEMIQYQQQIYKLMREYSIKYGDDENKKQFDEINRDKRPWFQLLNFPNHVPQSEIVFDGVGDVKDNLVDMAVIIMDYKIKAHKIYMKYIDYNSMFQINIPFKIRHDIAFKMDDYQLWLQSNNVTLFDLLKLFEKSCDEMYTLMRSSYDRFSLTYDYQKLKNCIFLS